MSRLIAPTFTILELQAALDKAAHEFRTGELSAIEYVAEHDALTLLERYLERSERLDAHPGIWLGNNLENPLAYTLTDDDARAIREEYRRLADESE